MRRVLLVFESVYLLAFCALLSAQQFPKPQIDVTPASQPETIHLDVLVKDQSGTPIRGIPQQFFSVMDNSQPQKLLNFKEVDTNNDPVQVLIVMDMINLGYDSVTWGREQLSEYLKQEGGSLHNPTSIVAITEEGLEAVNGTYIDGNQLQAEFRKIATDIRPVTPDAGWEGIAQLYSQSLEQFSQILAIEKTHPGRKLILFVSPGWPSMGGIGSEEDLKASQSDFNIIVGLTNTIRDARTAIYRLDTSELGGRSPGGQDPFYYRDFLKPVTDPKKATYPYLELGVFAVHSGGSVLVTGKSITGELNNALRDAGSYYELTYAAPPAGPPNQYHAVKVQVNQPGTFIQTIAGYYADPQNVGPRPKPKKKH